MIREQSTKNTKGLLDYKAVQIAKIKGTDDEAHSGKLKVWLIQSNTDENNPDNWINVRYAQPFAGITDPANMTTAVEQSEGTQKSYGFFAVPPDVGNLVLVVFANGEPDEGFWFSGLYVDTMTHMIPGIASNTTYSGTGPAAEVNRYSAQIEQPKVNPMRPAYSKLQNVSGGQEVTDGVLGVGDQSVWRDLTPSVMGWLSPGGNQLVLDDKQGQELIRLRTASGTQLLLSEATGDVFAISKGGNSYIKLGNDGNVDVFASEGFNVKAKSINMKADENITMESATGFDIKSETVNIEGSGSLSLKAPPWAIVQSPITGDVWQALQANASPGGEFEPIGDVAGSANTVSESPARGGFRK